MDNMRRGTMKRLITLAAIAVLALAGCGSTDAPEQPTREELAQQSDRLAMAMLSWEVQAPAERKAVCATAKARGQDATQRAWAEQQGGTVDEWGPATSWLLRQCERAGN